MKKVKLINILGQPEGIITRKYFAAPGLSHEYICQAVLYWVRLNNGILIKDVIDNEFEYVK